MPTISDLVSRRTDLSTFVVHLTREYQLRSAKDNLLAILTNRSISARSAMGSAIKPLKSDDLRAYVTAADRNSQRVVCFTETPLEHLHLMLERIDDLSRNCEFKGYGIAMTKKVAREHAINPIWYMDITPGHDWLTNPLNRLIAEAARRRNFAGSDIARLTPFIEQMGSFGGRYRKEFWWEREWRHLGDFELPDRVIVIAPEDEHDEFAHFEHAMIDAEWGIEAIIARLAGFRASDVGPF